MSSIMEFLREGRPAGFLKSDPALGFARQLSQITDWEIYPRSVSAAEGMLFALGKGNGFKKLVVLQKETDPGRFEGVAETLHLDGKQAVLTCCELTPANARALGKFLPCLVPRTLGLRKSAGCGDRLGLATPGHIRAAREVNRSAQSEISLILAQQSMRENKRTGRTPEVVLNDATWGVLQEGWIRGFGADADHLKTIEDVETCVAAGYTFFTIDPGDYVDDTADQAGETELREKAATIPWELLDTDLDDLTDRFTLRPVDLGDRELLVSGEEVLRASVKYGRALAHTVAMYRHLWSSCERAGKTCELEVSVDETATTTTTAEHVYIASELQRLGVRWVSLAPRYFGRFEKGVDFLGEVPLSLPESLEQFRLSFSEHVAVSKVFGPYKLSLHSGSDKFSIYPIVSEEAGDLVHLKTAGTSYLEALRTVSVVEPDLFREIVDCARLRYPKDRASYHVSAELDRMIDPTSLPDSDLADLLEDFHAREILHVTFGSVVTNAKLRSRLMEALDSNEEGHYGVLEKHFMKHLAPFSD